MNKGLGDLKICELFLQRAPSDTLILLLAHEDHKEPSYASNIAKGVDVTYSHIVKILDIFEAMDFVTFEKKGRVKFVKLTAKGRAIAESLRAVKAKLK